MHHCPHCDTGRAFLPQIKYSYGSFDVLFGFVYNKRCQLACPQCNHGWLLDTREMEHELGGVPIPFRLRHGMQILLACIGTAGVITCLRSSG